MRIQEFLNKIRPNKGFTLIEMLISASLFGTVGLIALTTFMSMSQASRIFTTRQVLFDDAQFIMNQLVKTTANSMVDYEEYYNQIALGGGPGLNYGYYASAFFFSPSNPSNNVNCSSITLEKSDCVTLGVHPAQLDNFEGIAKDANAFQPYQDIPDDSYDFFCDGFVPGSEFLINNRNYACLTTLYLVTPEGDHKIHFARERRTVKDFSGNSKDSWTLSRVDLTNEAFIELNVDQQIITPGLFSCESNCSQTVKIDLMNIDESLGDIPMTATAQLPSLTDLSDENDPYITDYIPVSPFRTNVKDLRFYISPVEDPHKAFSEGNLVRHPSITIVLTVEPLSNVTGTRQVKDLTLQTTVTPRLFHEVLSFPPYMKMQGKNIF